MQPVEFQQRLDQLLDQRVDPCSDPEIRSAIEKHPVCREILEGYELMLDSLSVDCPDLPDHFAHNVVSLSQKESLPETALPGQAMPTPRASRRAYPIPLIEHAALYCSAPWRSISRTISANNRNTSVQYALAAVAIAASIALVLVLRNLPSTDTSAPTSPLERQFVVIEPTPSPAQQEEYLRMMRKTGQAIATFPNTVRRVSTTESFDSVATPVTYSVSTAIGLLREVLPESSIDSES